MSGDFVKRLSGIIYKRNSSQKARSVVFGFFLIVSAVLWYLNKLTYEYTTEITYPLRIENIPTGKVIIGNLPTSITLQVRDYGYTLLRLKMTAALSPITIKLEETPPTPSLKSSTKFYLVTSRARNIISNQVQGVAQLGRISPDTLFFEFTTMAQKRVRVVPNITYTFEKQFMQSGSIIVKPDTIAISGPQAVLDSIKEVLTQYQRAEQLNTTHTVVVPIKEYSQVGLSHRKVNITIPTGKFTEANYAQRIEVRNLPDSLRVTLIPQLVNVKCNVIVDKYRNLLEGSVVKPYVDFRQYNSSVGHKLKVNVASVPNVADVIKVEPNFVEFIIERY